MTGARRLLASAAGVVTLLAVAVPALAYWTASSEGDARSTAGSLPTGSQPTAVAAGSQVTVGWSQSSIAGLGVLGGVSGGGYAVTRYADGSTAPVVPGAACGGVIAGTSASLTCAESSVPEGLWRYAVTPRLSLWAGLEGPLSALVLVDVTSPTTTASVLPAPNAAGWVRTPVTVSLAAVDNVNGCGVASIAYSATGAQPISLTTYTAAFAVGLEGITTLFYAATDNAGNVESTKTLTIRIDGTAPTGSILAPSAGATISGLTTVTSSSADALSGVAAAEFQLSVEGSGAWTTFGTASLSPWRAVLDTGTVADGSYQLRVVTTDWAGNTFTSADVDVLIDNQSPTGIDIQTANGGSLGTIDAGDSVTYTFSEPIATGSILPGWTGAGIAVTVRAQNGGGTGDRLTVFGVNLGTVRLGSRVWVQGGTTSFSATMTMTSPNVVTVTIGACTASCTRLNTGVGNATFTWTPSGSATDLAGHPVSTTVVTETGGPKQNF